MENGTKFSCVIVGGGTLPILCAEILISSEHEICTMISSDAEVKSWSKEKKIPYFEPTANLPELFSKQPFDYLFSIVNEHILREDVLRLPRKLAINYHDGLLPRYAGTHATSWALMNGETVHGITWHLMTNVVDAGDILKQQRVEIAENDTALTLNTKCYEAAISSFSQLVGELASGSAAAKEQNLGDRTLFARYKRPATACVISWRRRASDIDALVRALSFGAHANPLGIPKLALDNDFVIIPEIEILNSVSHTPPGTITKTGADFLCVSTKDREVVMRKALTLQGRPISMPDLVARYNLHPGYRFADPDAAIAGRLEAIYAASSRHEEFWVKRLASLKPAELPYTNSRASSTGVHGHAEMPMDIPDEIFRFLEEQRPEWSTGDFLLAAYGAFIARLGGVNSFDVAYGESDLQSEVAELDKLFAINLPLRIDIDCSQSFPEILSAVKARVEFVRNHSTYAHDLVARYPELSSLRDSGGTFILPLAVQRVERLNDCKIPTGCEVLLSISENGSGCRWIYDRDKLEEASAIRLRDHFATFLRSIIANPKKPVASLTLLTEEERHQLLVDWNDNHADYPKDQCIHQLFEEQAARTPDADAVIFGERQLSYLQLNQQANQLAHFLRTLGVGPEVPVGICVERSLEMIIGLLGVLKAGAAYVPLDPAYPKERLSFKLQDSQAPVLLTQRRLASGFNQQAVRIVCLDTDWKVIAQESEQNPSSNVTPENLAYIIYTSGSTGRPKGVVIAHSALVSHSVSVVKHYELDPSDRVLQFASIGFDVAAEEILATLLSGAAVVLSVGQVPPSVSDFIALIEKERLTVINLPSCYWHELVLELDLSQRRLCSTLRLVVTGSDRVLPHRLTTWRKMFGDSIRWLNAYGPTETTVTATIYEPAGDDSYCETGAVPIGRPMANRQVYILDSYLNPVPVGVPGELYIGGAGLARGYLNSPDITSEKFIPNPFQRELGAKLYKTGDRSRHLPDGNIEFLGRMDRQVKVRGFRIELDEIENALVQHPSVRACAVVAREDNEGETKLIAYLAPAVDKLQLGPSLDEYLVRDDLDVKEKQGHVAFHHLSVSGAAGFKPGSPCHINSQEVRSMQKLVPTLRHLLQEKLPDYMVPSAFVMLDELPLTPNGKVNPQALPTSELSTPKLESAFIPLRDPVALQLTSIWEDVLGIRPIGMDDNFFEVGGHSLQGVRIFAEVEKTFGKNIPLATLLEAGTIRKLADILRQDNWSAPESSLVAIQPNGPKPPFFCIHALRGKVLLYRELAWHLGLDQPFYGLQARHLNGLRNDYESVEEMAEYYIKEIQTIQPEGPYFLGGLSFGGLAAFEMARQLYAEGHKVALLALFDAGTPDYERLEVDDFVRRAQHHWEMLGLLNLQGKVEYVLSKAGRVIGTYYKKLNRKHGIMGPRKFHSMHQRLPLNDFQVEDKIRKAFERYVPPVYPGKMTLFRAASRPPGVHQDPMLGWEGIATGGLEIHEVPGDHGSIVVEPHVGPLAETLKRCLEKAHAEANQAEQAQSGALF